MTTSRRAARLRARFATRLSADALTGYGTLVEVSRTGGLVEMEAVWRPDVGSPVALEIEAIGAPPVTLGASVVRHTDSGFAVAWDSVSIELLMLLDSLGAN